MVHEHDAARGQQQRTQQHFNNTLTTHNDKKKGQETYFCSSAKGGDDGAQVSVDEGVIAVERRAAQIEQHGGRVNILALTRRTVAHQAYLFHNVKHDDCTLF